MTGVFDVNRWFFDQEFFLTSYVDSDKVLDDFFNLCFLTGQSVCAFWHSSPDQIRRAFIAVDNNLRQGPAQAGPDLHLDWSQFRLYVWIALKNPISSWTGAGGFDKFLALLEQNQLSALTAPAASALFQYIARGNNEITSNETLVDPTSGLRNGGEGNEVIAAVDNPYSFGDIQSLLPFFQSQAATSTGYLVQSILATHGILSNCKSTYSLSEATTPAIFTDTFFPTTTDLQTGASERPSKPFANIATSYPLLFLSNLRDPLTPLQE